MRDKDLLKYLLGIILIVIGYMSAYTALVLDRSDVALLMAPNITTTDKISQLSILEQGSTSDGEHYYICKELSWDYVTETGMFD